MNLIRRSHNALRRLPGGMTVFSKLIGHGAPYTGTLDATVVRIRPGYARVELEDRTQVRNHLDSIHAMALANLGELTTGLALSYALPDDARTILSGFEIDYIKKARGVLTAESNAPVVESSERRELLVGATIRDREHDVVAEVKARWLVGPTRR